MADIDTCTEEINDTNEPMKCFNCGTAILPNDRYHWYVDRTFCSPECSNAMLGYMIDMAEYQFGDNFMRGFK